MLSTDIEVLLLLQNALEGREFVTLSNKLCDIRDGARAHILAAEHDDAEVCCPLKGKNAVFSD